MEEAGLTLLLWSQLGSGCLLLSTLRKTSRHSLHLLEGQPSPLPVLAEQVCEWADMITSPLDMWWVCRRAGSVSL